jgi:hypothetical protein
MHGVGVSIRDRMPDERYRAEVQARISSDPTIVWEEVQSDDLGVAAVDVRQLRRHVEPHKAA